MSVLDLIASRHGRLDDVPNQELAKALVARRDEVGIRELVENLNNPDKAVQSDCIKVLYEAGYLDPKIIARIVGSSWGSWAARITALCGAV